MEVRRSKRAYSDIEALYNYILEASGLELTAAALLITNIFHASQDYETLLRDS